MTDMQITKQLNRESNFAGQRTISLHLIVSDPDVVTELSKIDRDEDRSDFALSALRVGVLALRQAHGEVDSQKSGKRAELLRSSVENQLEGLESEYLKIRDFHARDS